jgi:hypothetical protein
MIIEFVRMKIDGITTKTGLMAANRNFSGGDSMWLSQMTTLTLLME